MSSLGDDRSARNGASAPFTVGRASPAIGQRRFGRAAHRHQSAGGENTNRGCAFIDAKFTAAVMSNNIFRGYTVTSTVVGTMSWNGALSELKSAFAAGKQSRGAFAPITCPTTRLAYARRNESSGIT
jgi:hypothetical protein